MGKYAHIVKLVVIHGSTRKNPRQRYKSVNAHELQEEAVSLDQWWDCRYDLHELSNNKWDEHAQHKLEHEVANVQRDA